MWKNIWNWRKVNREDSHFKLLQNYCKMTNILETERKIEAKIRDLVIRMRQN